MLGGGVHIGKGIHRKYTDEFKERAVNLVTDQGDKLSEASRDLGVHSRQLRRWLQSSSLAAEPATVSVAQLQAEVKQLNRENERLRRERDIKKDSNLLREKISLRFSFIDFEKKAYPLFLLCNVVEASRSGYYRWKQRSPSARDQERMQLIPRIRSIHQETQATYGSRRMAKELEPLGLRCGRYTAGTLMKWAGVEAKRRRKLKATTDSKYQFPVAPNLLNHAFTVTRLNCEK